MPSAKPIAAIAGLVLLGAISHPPAHAQEVAAKAGTADIRLDEIEAFLKTLGPEREAAVRSNPAVLSQAVRLYLTNRVVLQTANANKWADQPEVKAALEAARDTVLVETYLQSLSKTPSDFPNDAQVQAFYNANAQSLFVPRQYQLAQIFIAAPKDGDKAKLDEAAKKLAAAQTRLKAANADFAAIAKEFSEAPTAERGGELGWVPETALRKELLDKVSVLQKGAVAEAVQLEDGHHILKMVDTRSAGPLPLDAVKPQIVARLREQQQAQLRRQAVAKLLTDNPVTVNEFALS
jgi:peptidylprolyl isomerase